MTVNSKEFLNERVLEVNYHRIQPFIDNKSVKYSLNFLNSNYGLSDGSKISLNNFKKIFLDMLNKFKNNIKEEFNGDDKYQQKGWNRFFNKLKKFFTKVWNRAFSIICSISASIVVFTLGFVFSQSLMAAIVVCSVYSMITFSIKYFAAQNNNTNMFYEPSNVKVPKLSSVVEFIKFMYKFIKDTIVNVFNWFFYEIEDDDKKQLIKRRRRITLLFVLIMLILMLVMI